MAVNNIRLDERRVPFIIAAYFWAKERIMM